MNGAVVEAVMIRAERQRLAIRALLTKPAIANVGGLGLTLLITRFTAKARLRFDPRHVRKITALVLVLAAIGAKDAHAGMHSAKSLCRSRSRRAFDSFQCAEVFHCAMYVGMFSALPYLAGA